MPFGTRSGVALDRKEERRSEVGPVSSELDLTPSEDLSVYELLQIEPFIADETDNSNAEEKEDMEQVSRSVYPEVHKTTEEKLVVFREGQKQTYSVVSADDEESKKMEDYFRHETAHLFGDSVENDKTDPEVTKRATKRAAIIEDADEAMARYNNRDNLTGGDLRPGTISCVDVVGGIVVMSDENMDLELMEILREENKENIANAVRAGCPVRCTYYLQMGEVNESDTAMFDAFRDSTDLITLVTTASELRDKLPRRHAARFTKALTDAMNDLVRVSLGTGLFISDFFNDVEELATAIGKRYGDDSPVSKTFLSEVPQRIASRCGSLVNVSCEDKGTSLYQHLLPCVWQQLPTRARALNFSIGETRPYGFVSRSRFPELYNLVDSLLSEDPQLEKNPELFDVRFETNDGFSVRCHRSLLGDKLLISKV